MGQIIQPSYRRSQPPTSLVKPRALGGLGAPVFLHVGDNNGDLSGAGVFNPTSLGTPTKVDTQAGRGLSDFTSDYDAGGTGWIPNGQNIVVVGAGRLEALNPAADNFLFLSSLSDFSDGYHVVAANVSEQLRVISKQVGATARVATASKVHAIGDVFTYCVVIRGTGTPRRSIFLGTGQSGTQNTGAGVAPRYLRIQHTAATTNLLTALYRTNAISDADAAELARNPWQVLERRIWVPVSAGGATTHDTTGALTGAGSTVAGTASNFTPHATSGALTGPGAAVVGSAAHIAVHGTSGALTGPGSSIAGSSARTRAHPTSGALTGPGSVVDGTADHAVPGGTHDTSGALTGPGSSVVGSAAHIAKHATTGVLVGPGAVVDGTAARVAAAVTHDTSGALVGPGAVVGGQARGPEPDPQIIGGGGWLPKLKRRTKKELDEERRKLGILPPEVVEEVAAAPVARRRITLQDLIGKKAAAQITNVDLSDAIAASKRRKRQKDDELLLLM
jgi:hypothetical protein